MNQHTYVENCQRFYLVNGLQPGNPDDGDWEDAHYPLPKGKGDDIVLLLFEHHQVQGLLQSEEVGRCCFFKGHAKHFLTYGPFVENWFGLWDLYDKWSSDQSKRNHFEKNEEGKSVRALENNKKLHEEKDEQGRSLLTLRAFAHVHDEKTEDGKSALAVESGKKSHLKKDPQGRSLNALRSAERLNKEKDEQGRSVNSVRAATLAPAEVLPARTARHAFTGQGRSSAAHPRGAGRAGLDGPSSAPWQRQL